MRLSGQSADCIDIRKSMDILESEIDRGLKRLDGGIPMSPVLKLPENGFKPKLLECVSVDIGGTTLKSAKVLMNEKGEIFLSDIKKGPVPGIGEPVTEREFFSRVAEFAGIDRKTENVAVSFSHFMEPLPKYDARITGWCKEILVNGASGKSIGGIMRDVSGNPGLNVRVTNDSAASLLGCIEKFGKDDILLGVIVGTGFNICWKDDSGMLFNTEIGNSHAFPQGTADREIDAGSACPGEAVCEKMVSGVYLEKIISRCIEADALQGCIADAEGYKDLSLEEYCAIADRGRSPGEEKVSGIVRQAIERSATIAAVCAASLIRHNSESDGKVLVASEGSVLNKVPGYRDTFRKVFAETAEDGRCQEWYSSDCAGIKGAARLMWME